MKCWWIQLDDVHQKQQVSTDKYSRNLQIRNVKDADLVNEDLPTERPLRVYWNVETR